MDNPIENENNFKNITFDYIDYMFNYIMYHKYGAIIVTIVLIILIFVILIPFINLDYHADLCERIENLNKLCLYNHKDNNLPIKNTYLWNLCNYLYDYKDLDKQLKTKEPNVIDKKLIKLYEIGDKVVINDDIKTRYVIDTAEINNKNKVTQLETYLEKIKVKFNDIKTANDNINKLKVKKKSLNENDIKLEKVIDVIKELCSYNFNIDTYDLVLEEKRKEKYKFFKKDNYDILVKFDDEYNFKYLEERAAAKDAPPPSQPSDEADEIKKKLDELAKKINEKSGNTKDHLTDVFSEKNKKLYVDFNYTLYEEKNLHRELEIFFSLQKKLQDTKKYLEEYHKAVEKLDKYVQIPRNPPIDPTTLASEHELNLKTMYEISKVICANKLDLSLHDLSGTYCDNYPKLEDYNPEFNTEKEVILKYYSAVDNWLSRNEGIIYRNIKKIIEKLNVNYEYYKTTTFVISIFIITLVIIIIFTGIINIDNLNTKFKKYRFFGSFVLIIIVIILNTLYMQYSKYSADDDEVARNWKKLILDKKDNTSEQGIIEDFIGFHGLTWPVILGFLIGIGWWNKRDRSDQNESISRKYLILARDILWFILLLTIASYATLYGIFNETKNYNEGDGGDGGGGGSGGGETFENKTMKIKDTIYQLYSDFSSIEYKVFFKPFIVANSLTTSLLFGLLIWFFIHFNDDFNFNTFILYGSILIFIFFVIIVVFFGLSVKKFSEIYSPNDTNCYAYIMTIVELDYLINDGANQSIKNIFKSINSNNIKIDDIILTDVIIDKIEDLKKDNIVLDYKYAGSADINYIPLTLTSFDKSGKNKLITLKNLECLYNDKKLIKNKYNDGKNFNDNIDRIKEEIADVTRFKYAYIFLLTILLFILSKLLKYNFTYIAFSIIAIILICLFIYKIQNQLEA